MSLLETIPELHRQIRGHRFYGEDVLAAPALYSTEDIPREEKIVVAHYFLGGANNWWIIEADPETGIAFAYCLLNGDWQNSELGYVQLMELENLIINGVHVVERDLGWQPTPLSEILEDAD